MLLLALASSPVVSSGAHAASFVVSVGEEQATGLGGGWARAWPNDDGTWRFVWSAGGDYVLLPMTEDLTVTDSGRTALSGRTNLVDHGISRCPDGSFLHAASANLDSFNDSAYAFRYDADFGRTAEGTVEERVTSRAHNDLAVVCSGPVSGVAFWARDGGGDSVLFPVGEDASVGAPVTLPDSPQMTGGSLYYEAESDTLLALNFSFNGPLVVSRYTTDFALVESMEIHDVVEGPRRGYWAQGLLRVGDVYVLAHMARDDNAGFQADEGDVWLAFFDTDWNFLERRQISQNTAPLGGMRPGLARRGDQLLVFYDKEVQPRLFDVRLDLAAMGVEGTEDSGGGGDTGGAEADDTADPDGDGAGGACGCASGGDGVGVAGLLLGVALVARRRR